MDLIESEALAIAVGLGAFQDLVVFYDSSENPASCVFGGQPAPTVRGRYPSAKCGSGLERLGIVPALLTRAAPETSYGQFGQQSQSDELDQQDQPLGWYGHQRQG